jgi:hypothetical protein
MPITELLQYYFDLLPIIVSLFFLIQGKKTGMLLWVILFYAAYSFGNNTILVFLDDRGSNPAIWLYIFTVIEYTLFAFFIYHVLSDVVYKRALLTISVLFITFCLFNIFFQPKYQFDSLQTSIEALILLIFCILFLFEQINKPEITFIYNSYTFWVITGILIYLAANFFLYGFAATLPKEIAEQYWFISHISNVLKNIFFSIAVIVHIKKPNLPISQKPPEQQDYLPYMN